MITLDDLKSIPQRMREMTHWVAWREETRITGNTVDKTKPPINPHDGERASPTDPTTWGTLEQALARAKRDDLTGVGFVLTQEAGIIGIDLDKCRNPETGELTLTAQRIVNRMASYTEISPSGRGVHIFVEGTLPNGARKKNDIEMYQSARYFTVTGNRIESVSAAIEQRQNEINALGAFITVDARVIHDAKAQSDPRFSALWLGKWEEAGYTSQSEADLALCNMILAMSRDPEQIDRVFRWSGLMRPKWDEQHGEQTYGAMTIAKALTPSGSTPASPSTPRSANAPSPPRKTILFDPKAILRTETPILSGLLNEGELAVWLGREKHRKTNVILQAAICAAVGRPFLSFGVAAPIQVTIIDYETKAASLKRRYDAIVDALNLTPEERDLATRNLHIVLVREMLRNGDQVPKFPAELSGEDFAWWQKLVAEHPAQLYIIDPMRSLHKGDENDSKIEGLLSNIRAVFGKGAVIVAHHLRKRSTKGDDPKLIKDMRAWSDLARGSSAIKAHADVIVCQELVNGKNDSDEVVYLGAFSKDAADIEPLRLVETAHESFLWCIEPKVPSHLAAAWRALGALGHRAFGKAEAVSAMKLSGIKQATAYRHLGQLQAMGMVIEREGGLILAIGENKPTSCGAAAA